jgi:hypothetical protein
VQLGGKAYLSIRNLHHKHRLGGGSARLGLVPWYRIVYIYSCRATCSTQTVLRIASARDHEDSVRVFLFRVKRGSREKHLRGIVERMVRINVLF